MGDHFLKFFKPAYTDVQEPLLSRHLCTCGQPQCSRPEDGARQLHRTVRVKTGAIGLRKNTCGPSMRGARRPTATRLIAPQMSMQRFPREGSQVNSKSENSLRIAPVTAIKSIVIDNERLLNPPGAEFLAGPHRPVATNPASFLDELRFGAVQIIST